jgi:hypothetical protein
MSTATLNSLRNAEPLRSIAIPGDPSIPTRHRWALTGVRAPSGERVRLQAWRAGGKLLTTPEAVERFILALSGDAPASEADDAVIRRGREAGRALEALGC